MPVKANTLPNRNKEGTNRQTNEFATFTIGNDGHVSRRTKLVGNDRHFKNTLYKAMKNRFLWTSWIQGEAV